MKNFLKYKPDSTSVLLAILMLIVLLVAFGTLQANRSVLAQPSDEHVHEDEHEHEHDETHDDDEHDEDHTDHEDEAAHDSHDDHGGHEGHEEGVVRLDEHQLGSLDVTEIEVRRGSLGQTITLPGEVQWNGDRVVHVTPRVGGIVLEVFKSLGDRVESGDRLTLLDSAEIGQARMDYLEAISRHEVDKAELDRLERVVRNTRQLLASLDAAPTPDTFR